MRATFVLGRIAGVRIGVHWSVLVIFTLIALGLAQSRLPDAYPGHPWPVYWVVGLATSVVFFASLLAHELAHATLARRNGIDVEDIVLWLLGGAARIKTEARTPGAELRIAGVGPLVSLLAGGFFALAAWLLDVASAPGLAVEAVTWLAAINIILAVFNAIPAAPLDGGRLLRAFLWWRTGDRARATAGATAAGRVFGWFLVVAGLYLFLGGGAVGGLWMALIGWFLVAAASAEGRQAQFQAVLAGIPVRHAMTPDPVTVPIGLTVGEFLAEPRYRYRHSAFPVAGDDGAPAGLVTVDAAKQVPDDRRGTVEVGAIMLPLSQVAVVAPDDPLADLLTRTDPGTEHPALVLEGGKLVGIVSPSDVNRTVNWLMRKAPPKWGGR
ncbi:site-2 protease family protein [Streptomyces sp. P1-3]|uniref:site-2 protease family protein n=1 Tax=Streptomyces sp. P1-3 TaxID=3421658 RepID=UPI003D364585